MNLIEVENVFGTLSAVSNAEKKTNWIPAMIILTTIGVIIILDIQAKLIEQHCENKTNRD